MSAITATASATTATANSPLFYTLLAYYAGFYC
jgi:hypothetical protein